MATNQTRKLVVVIGVFLMAGGGLASRCARAEPIKIGLLPAVPGGPIFIAQEKGYFAAEGLSAELVFFHSAQPVGVAVVANSIDFGVTGVAGGTYSLASQGALRIIGGAYREFPGFQYNGYGVSKQAYAGGLLGFKDLPGHSVALSQIASPPHYALSLLAEKYKLNLATIRVLPLQSVPNMVSAITGGQSDATIMDATALLPVVQRGDAKLLGWVGDETPWQIGASYAARKTADDRRDTVERFLRAYRRGAREYHDAFIDQDEKRHDGPTAPDILAILAKYLDQSPAQVAMGIAYIDAQARLDVKDVLHQIAWYRSQGLVKGDFDPATIIDTRYVVPLPGQ